MLEEYVEIINCWFSRGKSPMHNFDEKAVIDKYGCDALCFIKKLYSDYCLTNAWKENDFDKMYQIARGDFIKLYPNASEDLINALFWMYSYDVTR